MTSYPYTDRRDDELSFPMKSDGFSRGQNRMQKWVVPDTEHPPAPDRYHLFLNYSCGWSAQVLLARSLKGLQNVITVSHTYQHSVKPNGWPVLQPDVTGNGFTTMREVYNSNNASYGSQQLSVPVLFDKHSKCVVSNDPAQMLLMLNDAFNEWASNPGLDLYPVNLRKEIEDINNVVYPGLNDGVYRCGFASNDEMYQEAYQGLCKAFDLIDSKVCTGGFLCGEQLTLADVRAFPHLIRFDSIYRQLFLRPLDASCPVLSVPEKTIEYVERLFGLPGVRETCDPHLAVVGYFAQLGGLKGMPKTPAQDDAIYEQFKYAWMPSIKELEEKRVQEQLPVKGADHLTASHLATL